MAPGLVPPPAFVRVLEMGNIQGLSLQSPRSGYSSELQRELGDTALKFSYFFFLFAKNMFKRLRRQQQAKSSVLRARHTVTVAAGLHASHCPSPHLSLRRNPPQLSHMHDMLFTFFPY